MESGEALQNAKCAESTRPASGMPICAIAPLQHFVKERVPFDRIDAPRCVS
jgi:hypothetical protein